MDNSTIISRQEVINAFSQLSDEIKQPQIAIDGCNIFLTLIEFATQKTDNFIKNDLLKGCDAKNFKSEKLKKYAERFNKYKDIIIKIIKNNKKGNDDGENNNGGRDDIEFQFVIGVKKALTGSNLPIEEKEILVYATRIKAKGEFEAYCRETANTILKLKRIKQDEEKHKKADIDRRKKAIFNEATEMESQIDRNNKELQPGE